jgi:hypothetical protein
VEQSAIVLVHVSFKPEIPRKVQSFGQVLAVISASHVLPLRVRPFEMVSH